MHFSLVTFLFPLIFISLCAKAKRILSENKDCQCGVFKLQTGEIAFPWVVYIHIFATTKRCVGTVISSNVVLTSRTCLTKPTGILTEVGEIFITDIPDIFTFDGELLPETSFQRFKPLEILRKRNCTKTIGIKLDYDFTSMHSKNRPVCVPTHDELPGASLLGKKVMYQTPNAGIISNLEVREGRDCDEYGSLQLGIGENIYCLDVKDPQAVLRIGQPIFMEVMKNPLSSWGGLHGHYIYLVGISTFVWEDFVGRRQLYFVPANSALNTIEAIANAADSRWCPQPWAWLKAPEKIIRNESLDCECGLLRNGRRHRIIGGDEAIPYEFPWLVKIAIYRILNYGTVSEGFCGGSIISDRVVLTAAHCIVYDDEVLFAKDFKDSYDIIPPTQFYRLFFNSHQRESDPEEIAVAGRIVVMHPGYEDGIRRQYSLSELEMDLAMLILDEPLDFSLLRPDGQPLHRPICFPKYGEKMDVVWKEAIVAGWGDTTRDSGFLADVVQKLKVTILPVDKCRKQFRNNTPIGALYFHKTVLCGGVNWNRNMGPGDSGGPDIVETRNGKYMQVGVNSFAYEFFDDDGKRELGRAFFYADVQNDNLLSWVDYYSNMYGAKYCKS